VRLRAFDYASAGAYFVTICTQDRGSWLGEIVDGELRPNHAGALFMQWWEAIPTTFPTVVTDAAILMPNHLHGVIFLNGRSGPVGAMGGPKLGQVVGWFKAMTTHAYADGVKRLGWSPFPGRLWQRNYYERVIRDDRELERIRQYIADNPARWAFDEENPHIGQSRRL
jgi:putative transposase